MKKYQYQLVQYVHDHFTGEFVNIGVIVYAPELKYLNCKVVDRYSRITALFPKANGRFINKMIKSIETSIKIKAKEFNELELYAPPMVLNKITDKILAPDNGAIRFTTTKTALDIDLKAALNDLYKDLVNKYMPAVNKNKSLSDNDVWQKKYKEYFEQLHIANKLIKHTLSTNNDEFTFEKAWKNEVWHCYQPVSFALQDKESIKDKVYKWAGRLQELKSSKEPIHLTFLTSTSVENKELENFIKDYLTINEDALVVDVVKDTEAKKFAQTVQELMLAHDN